MGRDNYYEMAKAKMCLPFIRKWDRFNAAKLKYQDRKKRVFMRGIKIGTKRKDSSSTGMGMFEMMKKSEAKQESAKKEGKTLGFGAESPGTNQQ